jgi:hypothetical protein
VVLPLVCYWCLVRCWRRWNGCKAASSSVSCAAMPWMTFIEALRHASLIESPRPDWINSPSRNNPTSNAAKQLCRATSAVILLHCISTIRVHVHPLACSLSRIPKLITSKNAHASQYECHVFARVVPQLLQQLGSLVLDLLLIRWHHLHMCAY